MMPPLPIHEHGHHGYPALLLFYTWQNAIIVAVHLIMWVLFVRFFGHKLTGESRVLRHGSILIGASLLWPLTDMGLFVGAMFHFGGKAIDFLTKR